MLLVENPAYLKRGLRSRGLGDDSSSIPWGLVNTIPNLTPQSGAGYSNAGAGYLPAGTQLVYNVTWKAGPQSIFTFQSPASVIQAVAQNVQANSGISVIGSSSSSGVTALVIGQTLTVQLNQNYTTPQQVQQVLDSAFNALVNVVSSNISVAGQASPQSGNAPIGGGPGSGTQQIMPTPSSASPDWLTWLETYGPWIGLGLAGLVITGFVIREFL